MKINQLSFEQGPIRPPNEARSLLLRLTRNCPWNQCLFCPVYKKRKFSLRKVEEIKQDIQAARDIADDIKDLSARLGRGGEVDDSVLSAVLNSPEYGHNYKNIAAWLYFKTKACFLQDADNLIMKTQDLVEVLKFLREKFPEINRVTTYSRSRTTARKSEEELKQIRAAGLNRVHIGLETGYDPLLKLMKKGTTAEIQIEAGRKCIEAGIELSEYVMPGLGGQEMWKEHAVHTAQVLNKINPNFIRLRSLRVPKHIPLYQKLEDKTFTMQTDDMAVEEIKLFIETLDGITSTITSDHIMNLLEEISGRLSEAKSKMLEVIDKYQQLSDYDRLIYRAGRRLGVFRSTDELIKYTEPYTKIESMISGILAKDGIPGVENFLSDTVDQYI